MRNDMTLADILESASELPWNEALYLPVGGAWSLDSPTIVWDPDDVADDEQEILDFAAQHGMKYVLGISTVQEIVANAQQQKPNCSLNDKFEALLYYVQNDAFLQLL